jgi:aspartate/glutamate racemase
VFHKEDGQKGLDRLIEYSNYIAISVPELRFLGQKNSVVQIANYIKTKKPNIDIHLLGCTELKLLKELSFCSSADSTSYKSGIRYGFIKQKHVKNIKTEEVKKIVSEQYYKLINKYSNEQNTNAILLHTYYLNQQYNLYAGSQD